MPAQDFTRPEQGYRFEFKGLKLNAQPDAIPPGKYAAAVNIRGTNDASIITRPGQTQRFAGQAGVPITDIRSYTAIGTDNLPRTLVRDAQDAIWLDTGAQVGTLAGGGTSPGATLIPFRPSQSPNPYMYVANGSDYQKFSAPDAAGNVTASRVGIAEPSSPVNAVALPPLANVSAIPVASWTLGGTASARTTAHRTVDFAGTVLTDPQTSETSVGISNSTIYQRGMVVQIGAAGNKFWVQDVYSSLLAPIAIQGIYYFAGATGRCVIVPQNLTAGNGTEGESLYSPEVLTSLRRGALIRFASGEVTYVLSVTPGPDGTIAIETSTTLTHTTPDTITLLPAIQVSQLTGVTPPASGALIGEEEIAYAVAPGIGYATAPLAGLFTSGTAAFQPDDYLSFAVLVSDPAQLIEAKLLFDVGNGQFNQDYYYYTVRPSDLTGAIANATTQLAAIQQIAQRALVDAESGITGSQAAYSSTPAAPGPAAWTQVLIPISSLTRVGSDVSQTLQNVNAVRFQWNVAGLVTAQHDYTLAVWGGSQPDVGNAGAPYLYRIRPRSSVTGAKGNPSPAMRYGISPRRQRVNVALPGTATDPQLDTWDVFRYGGAVTSWRFIGSQMLSISHTIFVDNYSDAAAQAGDELELDNFEPWPSIDTPLTANASVTGTIALVTIAAPTNALRYLPGNLVRIGGQTVYTLRRRPTLIAGSTYQFEFEENAGVALNVMLSIYEPILARQFLPYMWGPDANGTIFACGDPLRPGTLYFAKNYAPDAAPDTYNMEISPPSEPLLGGEIVDGLSIVGSSERWWALYPQPDNPTQRYNMVPQPLDRGLAAPYGHATDNRQLYFWAKDGISSTNGSLTAEDLTTLFPHEGIPGRPVTRGGVTFQPPDYSRAGTFRLTIANGYLYAIYQDATATYRCLTLQLRTAAWVLDQYTPAVSAMYHPEQPAGTLLSSGARYDELLQGTVLGIVAAQTPLANDLLGPIACVVYTQEFDGGDLRVGDQWGDLFIDSVPSASSATLTVTPMSLGVPSAPPTVIPQVATRVQQPVSVGGALYSIYMGMLLAWTDDFTLQAAATVLYAWQPSFIPQPESTADRFTDWDDAGLVGAKWWQGFILTADTFAAVKNLLVRDSDTLAAHPFTPAVQHAGESEIAYSFDPPFIAHQVRIEPTDLLLWKLFGVRWVFEPTPEMAETWQTQYSTFGLRGYMHLRQMSVTYAAVAPLTIAVTSYDGLSPAAVTLPSTGGAVNKVVFPLTANKGQLYKFRVTSTLPFQFYQRESEMLVGAWGREDAYVNRPLVGAASGDEAKL